MDVQNPPTRETGDEARPRFLGETVRSASGESNGWHSHGFGQLISAASGTLHIGTTTHTLLLSPAMVLWIPPDAEHWMRTSVHNEMLYVDVNRDEASKLGMRCRVMAITPLLSALMNATLPDHTTLRSQNHTDKLHDLLRVELVAAKDVPLSIAMPKDQRIRGFAEIALDDPSMIHSIDTWLGGAAASRKTIERLFVAETGMPPSRWLRQVRILHAVYQLAAGEKVSSVALNAGYESSSAFSYMFRRDIGLSPNFFCKKPHARRQMQRYE